MSRKSLIMFALIAGAMVFDGLAHLHKKASDSLPGQNQTEQNQAVTVAPTSTTDPANMQTQDQTASTSDPNATNDPLADAASGDAAAVQDNGNDASPADAADAVTYQVPADANADAPRPAPDPIIVPAGTTLTVRLGEEVGSRVSRANQRFSATLDRDVVVHGQTVIGAGTAVAGRVVLAKPAGPLTGDAKLQLKITAISVDNGNLRVVTSTRSFGPAIKGKNKVGRFMKGLVKRAAGQEHEVLLAERTACSFTLQRRLAIQ